jgi:signal transduction histidine kinase
MTPSLSLGLRLVFGALMWAAGLFTVAGVFLTHQLYTNPHAPRVFHRVFDLHAPLLLLSSVGLLAGGLWLVRRGVSPINQLRTRLAAVHAGSDRHVGGRYPSEVQPLVDDLNALLDQREQMVRRALAKAGDLAHGLKTPLAVLAQEADRAEGDGQRDLAATIQEQVDRMRRQVEYHLAHARAAASVPGARCSVRESVEGLTRTLQRLHAERGVSIDLRVPPELSVRGQREDLDEMLGNLLDNACRWARTRVELAAAGHDASIVITVDDDGPGLDPRLYAQVLQRGVRADEAAPGSGLGLAIVRELAELYGGSISLDRAPLGGLRARLTLPAA